MVNPPLPQPVLLIDTNNTTIFLSRLHKRKLEIHQRSYSFMILHKSSGHFSIPFFGGDSAFPFPQNQTKKAHNELAHLERWRVLARIWTCILPPRCKQSFPSVLGYKHQSVTKEHALCSPAVCVTEKRLLLA